AEDGTLTTEDRGTANDDCGDDVQVGQGLPGDGGSAVLGQRQQPGKTSQQTSHRVDLDQVPRDLDPHPPGGLLVGADGVGVPAELGLVQDDPADDDHDQGDETQYRDAEEPPVANGVGQGRGDRPDVQAAGDDLGQAQGDGQRAEGDDQWWNLRPGNQPPVQQTPEKAADHRGQNTYDGDTPPVATDRFHDLRGDD